MVTFSSWLIWQIICFILRPKEYDCIYSCTTLGNFEALLGKSHWKAYASKTSHCLVLSLVQRHNWAIFLRKWARRGRYSRWCNELLFTKIEEEDAGNIWFQQDGATCPTGEATLDAPCFWISHYDRRNDVVLPPWSWDLTPLDYYLWGSVKDKC